MLRLISWNINKCESSWEHFLEQSNIDLALLQEALYPPADLLSQMEIDQNPPWQTGAEGQNRPWRAAVVRLSDRVKMIPLKIKDLGSAGYYDFRVSLVGTLALAKIEDLEKSEEIYVASMYGAWENPAKKVAGDWGFADASVHRIISDQSALIGRQEKHKIIVSGDLNILRGYGEHGSPY